MASAVPLILRIDPVSKLALGPQKSRLPSVAVVYATAAGDLHALDGGKPLTWSNQFMSAYRTRYEVDISDHQRTVELRSTPPMAAGGVYGFDAILNVGFRVTDPAEIIRRNIHDGLTVVYSHLVFVCREIAAHFRIEEAKAAEDAINTRFRSGEELDDGITIYLCRARFSPDAAARQYLQAQEEARRSNMVKAAEHDVNVDDAKRGNQLELIRQSGDLEVRRREHEAIAGRPLNARELILLHLERYPQDTHRAFELLASAEAATADRQDASLSRQRELFEFMVGNGLVRPVDVARMRDDVVSGMQTTPPPIQAGPASVAWDDPLPSPIAAAAAPQPALTSPGLIPVYVVIDESLGAGVEDANAGIRTLYDALVQSPEIANVIRLSVFGFASDVDIQLALATVAGTTQPPRLTARGPARYTAAFQQLLDCIPRDAATLKAQHPSVRRPQVLFLTGTRTADGPEWTDVHRRLVDRAQLSSAPDIVACGVGDVLPETVASIATRPEYAFVAVGGDIGTAIAQFTAFVRTHVLNYGRAVLEGDQGPVMKGPDGFRAVTEIPS